MAHYKFITYWNATAPLAAAWDLIIDAPRWPEWWKGVVEVRALGNGKDLAHPTHLAQTWRSFIPYKLKFETEITAIQLHQTIEARVSGELEGTGKWEFRKSNDGRTTIIYYWFVRTTTHWMNFTAPLLSPVFRWNHDAVMRWGGDGLARKLNCRVKFDSEWIR